MIFTPPMGKGMVHNNKINGKVQFTIDVFCEDICKATEKWLEVNSSNVEIQTAISQLLDISYPDSNGILTLN
jgi:hypothetical protein